MTLFRLFLRRLALFALMLPIVALAERAYTNGVAALYAGPDSGYPVVAELLPNTYVEVAGCLAGYRWCDVVLADGQRGWVFAQSLDYPYNGVPAPLPSYGAMIGIPLIGFAIGSYWGSYYHDRPWYGERHRWHARPPRYGAPIHEHFRDRDHWRGDGRGGWDRDHDRRGDHDRGHDRRWDHDRSGDHDRGWDRNRDHDRRGDGNHNGARFIDRNDRPQRGSDQPTYRPPRRTGDGDNDRGRSSGDGRRWQHDRSSSPRDATPARQPRAEGERHRETTAPRATPRSTAPARPARSDDGAHQRGASDGNRHGGSHREGRNHDR